MAESKFTVGIEKLREKIFFSPSSHSRDVVGSCDESMMFKGGRICIRVTLSVVYIKRSSTRA
jgi:hypothetical protein